MLDTIVWAAIAKRNNDCMVLSWWVLAYLNIPDVRFSHHTIWYVETCITHGIFGGQSSGATGLTNQHFHSLLVVLQWACSIRTLNRKNSPKNPLWLTTTTCGISSGRILGESMDTLSKNSLGGFSSSLPYGARSVTSSAWLSRQPARDSRRQEADSSTS